MAPTSLILIAAMINYSASTAVNLALTLLVLFSLATWAMIFAKGWLQWRMRRENQAFAQRFWQAANLEAAAQIAKTATGSLASLARAGFDTLGTLGERKTLGLMLLASIGSTAPFVGLFGTVWGIMNAMENIARSGSAGLEVVAGPVGEALMATAIGIAAAVPAVLAYNYGVRVTRLAVAEMDRFANDFLSLAVTQSTKQD